MCEATMIIAAMSALVAHDQASSTASAQASAIEKNRALQEADLSRASAEQAEAGAAQMNAQARAAMKDMALFDVIAGEFGGGASAERGRAALAIQQGEGLATIGKNSDSAATQTSFQSLAMNTNANSQLSSISRPSVLGTALTIGGAVAGGMDRMAASKAAAAKTAKTPGIQ